MTPSESLVYDLCQKSFLSLWSYANPRRPDGRELCDVLVVFAEHVIVFSIKEIELRETGDPQVAADRWRKKAVEKSVDQLRGARRELAAMGHVIRSDGASGVDLVATSQRHLHFVAIAAGGRRSVPFSGGEAEDGMYVHALDEEALRAILGELDTAKDFIHYLEAKEAFTGSIICEGEENLLAIYLHGGRQLHAEMNILVVEDGSWDKVRERPEFGARKEDDRPSYWWDSVIETLIRDHAAGGQSGPTLSDHELVVRTMAAEDRFARRALSGCCLEWLARRQAGARSFVSRSGIGYLFGTFPRDWDRKQRTAALGVRSLVARSPGVLNTPIVIGLGTEVHDPTGYSLDVIYLHVPVWTERDEELARAARRDLGIMEAPILSQASLDEFPTRSSPSRSRQERNRAKRRRQRRK
jgi:hypothetical protein